MICPSIASLSDLPPPPESFARPSAGVDIIELQILLFDTQHFPTAKAFWQHTGDGICSRMAERALAFLGETPAGSQGGIPCSPSDRQAKHFPYSKNKHYSRRTSSIPPSPTVPVAPATKLPERPGEPVSDELLTSDLTTYLEERYGRNLPLFNAPLAKQALRRRIAGGLLPSDERFGTVEDVARAAGSGKKAVSEDDVYLYPGGMSAIWHAHDLCRVARRAKGETEGKSICYG